jgi:hypothetical protein
LRKWAVRLREVRRLSDVPGLQPFDAHVLECVRRIGDVQRRLLRRGDEPVREWRGERSVRHRWRYMHSLHRRLGWIRVPIRRYVRLQRIRRLSGGHGLQDFDESMHQRLRGWAGLRGRVLRRHELPADWFYAMQRRRHTADLQ